ncbi:HMCN1, partial [Symbiodinium pilosum]
VAAQIWHGFASAAHQGRLTPLQATVSEDGGIKMAADPSPAPANPQLFRREVEPDDGVRPEDELAGVDDVEQLTRNREVAGWGSRRRRRAIPCAWGGWTGWSNCNKACGTGETSRTRKISVQPQHGGKACSGADRETKKCNTHACPINCAWGSWTSWV